MINVEDNIKQVNNNKGTRVLYDKGAYSKANQASLSNKIYEMVLCVKSPKPKGESLEQTT